MGENYHRLRLPLPLDFYQPAIQALNQRNVAVQPDLRTMYHGTATVADSCELRSICSAISLVPKTETSDDLPMAVKNPSAYDTVLSGA